MTAAAAVCLHVAFVGDGRGNLTCTNCREVRPIAAWAKALAPLAPPPSTAALLDRLRIPHADDCRFGTVWESGYEPPCNCPKADHDAALAEVALLLGAAPASPPRARARIVVSRPATGGVHALHLHLAGTDAGALAALEEADEVLVMPAPPRSRR